MPCYHPWRTALGNVASCGQCHGCRAKWSREWSLRCMHEASLHESNSFVTLTYSDKRLPKGGSLVRSDFQKFMKRLRKDIAPQKVRYFYVGEYGENTNRPHYHALLFGVGFVDKEMLSMRQAFPVFRSRQLEALWSLGLSEIGSVTEKSAGYVCKYLSKRMTGSWAKAKYGERVPEYGCMSRNPGIGAGWIDRFQCEVYAKDGVVVRGAVVKPPRYYDLRAAKSAPELLDGVKLARHLARRKEDETPERLMVAEQCAIAESSFHAKGGAL